MVVGAQLPTSASARIASRRLNTAPQLNRSATGDYRYAPYDCQSPLLAVEDALIVPLSLRPTKQLAFGKITIKARSDQQIALKTRYPWQCLQGIATEEVISRRSIGFQMAQFRIDASVKLLEMPVNSALLTWRVAGYTLPGVS